MRASAGLTFALLLSWSCAGHKYIEPGALAAASPASVFALDLVLTRPGMQEEYLRGIAANWAGARHLARRQGVVRSYQALAAEPDPARGWDVLLITEYADSASFANREVVFREIFQTRAYLERRYTGPQPAGELRSFAATEVRLRSIAAGSP